MAIGKKIEEIMPDIVWSVLVSDVSKTNGQNFGFYKTDGQS
jgi:hypothetical protein